MSEQKYEISTPLPSIDFLEEYNDEISSNDEFGREMLNETLDNTSDIHFEDPEKKKKNDCETFEHDEVIDNLEHTELTPYVVIDFIKGEVQRCGESTKLRQLRNLFGTWQVDRDAINEVDGVLIRLGVCNTHFQFDNKYLHQSRNKQLKDFNQGIIQWRRCISCNKYITFFSRGAGCTLHSWHLNKQNIQVPCIGQYTCEALRDCLPVCKRAFDDINPCGITCTTLHADDTAKGLEYLGNWLINIAQTGNDKEKNQKILTKAFEALLPFADLMFSSNSTITTLISTTLNEPPSLFMIKTLFIEFSKKQEIEKKLEIKEKELEKKEIEKKEIEKKLEIEDFEAGLAFPHLKIWLSQVLASLSRMPRLLGSFQQLLTVCHVSSHSDRHEQKLAKIRMEESNPSNRLIRANNSIDETLNMFQKVIFDLLDFKEIEGELIYKTNFDGETIKRVLLTKLDPECLGPSPNVVILEPGANPNSDEEILHVSEMYKEDFAMNNHSFLDIIADEAIFPAVNYRSTARVLDLLWVAVGIAINIYIKKIGISLSDIIDDENDAHIWYLYYKWAGIWKVHWMGMRIGNFGLQRNSLSAAASLYAKERLNYCGTFKIPRDVNEDSRHVCFGFDEALKTFGVRFIKQNVYGNIIDEKNLRDQIKSSQDERERIDLLMTIYRQEVLKTEDRNPQGRRTIGVVRTKVKDYNSKKKAEKRKIMIPELTQPVVKDLNETSLTIEPQSK
ncbi:uncharacterized protein OCT59_026303 [Rhizophagus irregularis]|uniref:uncharacterized protein n=1 Tax=Rhizophagus irregularis TaxID=588596 RepID=UPI0033249839|nr:hypothetical protein OCT59_026303 [Rhizophagus irregularis]